MLKHLDGSPSRSSIRFAKGTVYWDDINDTAIKQQVNTHCKGVISNLFIKDMQV